MANPLKPPTVLQALAVGDPTAPVRVIPPSTSVVASTAYTLVLTDDGLWKSFTTNTSVTIPPNSSVPFPLYSSIIVEQAGSSPITVVAGTGVTLQSSGVSGTNGQYSVIRLYQKAVNTWVLYGGGSGSSASASVTEISVNNTIPAVTANYTVTGNVSASNLQVLNVTAASTGQMVAYSFVTGTGLSTGQKVQSQILPLGPGEANGGIGRYNLIFAETAAVASTSIGVTSMGFYDFYVDSVRHLLHASTGQRGSIMTYDVSNTAIAPVFVGESVRLNVGSQGNSRYLTPGPTTDTLYLVTTTGGHISKFDLSGGGVPALIADYTDPTNISNPYEVQFVGNNMFVLCANNSGATSGTVVLSAYDATAWPPTFLSKISTSVARFPSNLVIVGNYAIFCGPVSGSASAFLQSFDISNPSAMVLADTSDQLNRALGLCAVDNYLYTSSEALDFLSANLDTYQINTTTGKLTHISRIQAAYADGIGYNGGNYLFLGGRPNPTLPFDQGAIMLVDVSVRASPKLAYRSSSTYVEPRAFSPGPAFNSFWWGEDLGNAIHYSTFSTS